MVTNAVGDVEGETKLIAASGALIFAMSRSSVDSPGFKKRSTWGKRRLRLEVSESTIQPIKAKVFWGLLCLSSLRESSLPMTRFSALCRTTQLLSTMRSASSIASECLCPNLSRLVASRSESALFIWQPMVQIW